MTKTRHSFAVKAGRVFQAGFRYFSFLDYGARIPLYFRPKHHPTVVAVVSPPRCGSTLTYQILVSRLHNIHLSNVGNLLYATPALGAMLTSTICGKQRSSFQSEYGFVPGLCGESEGMRFWTHWSGQGLVDNPGSLEPEKLKSLYSIMQRASGGRTFVGGYLGHLFCMDLLRRSFPRIVFVHVTRDLLSNAYSLFKRSGEGWFSLVPARLRKREFASPHERVVEQLFSLHSIILAGSGEGDVYPIRYEKICQHPEESVGEIVEFGRNLGLDLNFRSCDFPDFRASIVDPEKNSDTKKIRDCIEARLEKEKDNYMFFKNLDSSR